MPPITRLEYVQLHCDTRPSGQDAQSPAGLHRGGGRREEHAEGRRRDDDLRRQAHEEQPGREDQPAANTDLNNMESA